jgi:hypothetical protein
MSVALFLAKKKMDIFSVVLFSQKSGVLNKAGRGVLRCVRGAAV